MGRAPCCEKTGLKKGPWTPQEDAILISYIHHHGHPNWRSLPKQAGLLRCGKSCRLRWTNYLRPDIKRGSFTIDEERTIIRLHQTIGNRWSVIASRLPGRTDNEIKNVWHTRLKKKLYNHLPPPPESKQIQSDVGANSNEVSSVDDVTPIANNDVADTELCRIDHEQMDVLETTLQETEESSFWSEDLQFYFSSWPDLISTPPLAAIDGDHQDHELEEGMDFWYNVFINAGDQLTTVSDQL